MAVNSIGTCDLGCQVRETNNLNNHQKKTNKKAKAREAFGFPSGITVDNSIMYSPCIKKLTSSEIFDIQYKDGTKLSDGSVLIRPVVLSLGDVDITPSKDKKGFYEVSIASNPNVYGDTSKSLLMKEKDLLANKSLCRGKIKQINNEIFSLSFIDSDGNKRVVKADKTECLKVLRDNFLYM